MEIVTKSATATIEFGRRIGEQLRGGEVIALVGPLGSGKTHLIKGIAAGAGAQDEAVVNSPTFVIVNEYAGRLEIYHIDAYRLDSVEQFNALGFDDYCHRRSVVLIEWADKVAEAIEGVSPIRIELSHLGAEMRKINITNTPDYLDVAFSPKG